MQGGTVSLADNAQPRPVALELTALGITARNLATDGSKPEPFQLTARAAAPGKGSGKAAPGKLDYQGTLALQPLAAQGKLDATRLPLQAARTWQVPNASINRLLWTPEGFTLVGWNDASHLQGLEASGP